MTTLGIFWSDIPEAKYFEVRALPKEFNFQSQSYDIRTEDNEILFQIDGDEIYEFSVFAVRFDSSKFQIKFKSDALPLKSQIPPLGFSPMKVYRGYKWVEDNGLAVTEPKIGTAKREEVTRLKVDSNDVIVIETQDYISEDSAKGIRDYIRKFVGVDREIMILSGGMKISVLSQGV